MEFALKFLEPRDGRPLPLLLLCPPGLPGPAPLAVCVHGWSRQPLDQLRAFAPLAVAAGFALALPLFDSRRHRCYQQLLHPRRGVRSDLELLASLDSVAAEHDLDARNLYLFGYSGGAQFVHRLALLHPGRVAALAAGAAGWYTWPDKEQPWPLGLAETATRLGIHADLATFLRLPMAVWVGERDTEMDPQVRDEPILRQRQGEHRLERGRRWVAAVRAAGQRIGTEVNVRLAMVPRAGHDFVACDRHGQLAAKVMDFFCSVRAAAPRGPVSVGRSATP